MEPALEHVNPALLLPVENDIRDRTSPDYRDYFHNRLVPDIKQRGVQQPVIAYREGARLRVLDGETRRLAALHAGRESIPALIFAEKPCEADLRLGQLLANTMRRDMQPLELASAYASLLELNGWTQADLAHALHVSPAHVAITLSISTKLHPEVQELVSARKLTPRSAYAISRLPMPQQMELARKAATLPMATESVEEAVAKLLGNGRKAASKPVKFSACGVSGVIKGEPLASLKAFHARAGEALKQIERNPALADVLPRLLKGEANGQ